MEKLMKADISVTEGEIIEYLGRLVDLEILLTNLRPAVDSEDFFRTAIRKIKDIQGYEKLTEKLEAVQTLLDRYNETKIGEGESLYDEICDSLEKIQTLQDRNYIKVDLIKNSFVYNKNISENTELLENLANFLVNMAPRQKGKSKNIEAYMEAFVEKYGEYVEIPVKEVLDNKIGLGSPFDSKYRCKPTYVSEDERREDEANKLSRYLLHKIFTAYRKEEEIVFTDLSIEEAFGSNRRGKKLPEQLELYCKVDQQHNGNYKFELVPGTGDDLMGKSIGRFRKYFFSSKHLMDNREHVAELIAIPRDGRCMNVGMVQHEHKKGIYFDTICNRDDHIQEIDINDVVVGAFL